ncbi:MAG TPA: AMP-binding protein [Amycolatopsis sp.]|nr:AMP-binding protein [Amycolatopsis sp.]
MPTDAPDEVPAYDDDPGTVALDPALVLPRRVAEWAAKDPGRPFLAEVTGATLSYGETWDAVRRRHTWLTDLGVRRGDRVISMLPASADAVVLWLAAACLGALEVPVNPDLRGTFLTHALSDPGATHCFVRPEFAETVARSGIDLTIHTIERGTDPAANAEPAGLDGLPAPDDPACVIYTSGTTGAAKGVIQSWAQFSATIGRIPRSTLTDRDAVYCCHPMFHVTGRTPLISMADVGGRVVFREKFSASSFLDDVRTHGCTSTTAYADLLLATPERPDDADNPLRVVLGSCGAATAHRFTQRFGVTMVEAYGSTEAGFPMLLRTPPADRTRRWCGTPRRGYRARVTGPDGADVPDGTAGELWIRPPARPMMMTGYLHRPEATAQALADGWFRTGDAVIRHAGGRFEFVDRLRDVIRRNGENISASAIETAVNGDQDVAECAVLGVPDPVVGQQVLLVVVPAGHGCRPAALWERLTAELPRHALPAYVVLRSGLPRTPTNKVRKAALLDEIDLDSAWRPGSRRG